jgi:O-antigen/teichoic acid export membrane protein
VAVRAPATAMRITSKNFLSNVAGQGGGALVNLATVPLFFVQFGAERYGVILFMLSLAGLVALVDLGLATTINRRLAEARGGTVDLASARDLTKTVAAYYFVVSAGVGLGVSLLAPWLCGRWLTIAPALQPDAVLGVTVWGAVLAVRWPLNLMSGVMSGLERQVPLNLITLGCSVARIGVILLVATLHRNDIALYAVVYGLFSLLEFALLGGICLRALPPIERKARLSLTSFVEVRAFTAGVAVATLAAAGIKLLDKLIISGTVAVGEYALYQSIFMLASGLTLVSAAAMRAFYPALTRSNSDPTLFAIQYRLATRLIVYSTAPLAGFIVINGGPILGVWTQSPDLAAQGLPLLRIVIVAMVLNSVMQAPQFLLWSAGLSKLTAINNVVALVLLTPLTFFLIQSYGLMGGVFVWLIFNLVYFVLFPQFLHRYVLQGEKWRWYRRDVGAGFLWTVIVFGSIATVPMGLSLRFMISAVALTAFLSQVVRILVRSEQMLNR